MSVTGGAIADVYNDSTLRGRMNMIWTVATLIGPLLAPVVSGFAGPKSWQLTFWVALCLAGVSALSALLIPETLAAKILRKKAETLNMSSRSKTHICASDINRGSILNTLVSSPCKLIVS
jgi:MFS family permease